LLLFLENKPVAGGFLSSVFFPNVTTDRNRPRPDRVEPARSAGHPKKATILRSEK
jgi:hypothetical protein